MTGKQLQFLIEKGIRLKFLLLLFILLLDLDPYGQSGRGKSAFLVFGDDNPKIVVTTWLGDLSKQQWKNDVYNDLDQNGAVTLVNGSTYIVTNEVMLLVFTCSASYPLDWEFSNYKWILSHSNTLGLYTIDSRRIAVDMENPKTFTYQSQLAFLGDSRLYNGKYTCKSFRDSSKQSNFTLFWEGGPFDAEFVMSGRNLSVYLEQDRIVFPCHVDNPFVEVILQVENPPDNVNETDQWSPVPSSPQLEYKPEVGFIFHKVSKTVEWMDPGNYRCITKDETDAVYMTLIPANEPEITLNSPIRGKASFKTIDTLNGKRFKGYQCCSNSDTPPTMLVHRCGDPSSCDELMPALKKQETINQGHNSLSVDVFGSRYKVNGSCVSVKSSYPGVFDIDAIQCFGDGIHVYQKFFVQNPKNLPIDKWDSTTLQEWVTIDLDRRRWNQNARKVANKTDTFEVYAGQLATFSCKAPIYFFSYGLRISTKNKAGKTDIFPDTFDKSNARMPFNALTQQTPIEMQIVVNISNDLVSLSCHVPVWNSSDWVKKTVYFSIKTPEPPTIVDPANESIFWTLNDTDKTIKCQTKGDPEPKVIWMKDNQIGSGSLYNVSRHEDGSYLLKIPIVTHDVQGDFKCISLSFAGQASKTFSVFVQESRLGETTTVIIVTIIILFIIVIGGFIINRALVQKKILDNLREFIYPSASDTPPSTTTTAPVYTGDN